MTVTDTIPGQLALNVEAPAVDRYAEQRAAVERVIEATAREHGGHVSPNVVRERVRALGVPPHVVGLTYQALKKAGRLAVAGLERSDDVAGGNAGKPHDTYHWRGAS